MNPGAFRGLTTMKERTRPRITERRAQRYVGVRDLVTIGSFERIAARTADLADWLAARGIPPAGPPFLRYVAIDMTGTSDVEAGIPVDQPVEPDGDVFVRTLPAGRHVEVSHLGPPAGLVDATAELLAWGREQGVRWDARDSPAGERWGCRLEIHVTDPRLQPTEWRTDLVVRLADDTGPVGTASRPGRQPRSSRTERRAGDRPSVNVSIDVPDLEAGLRFYGTAFGFLEVARPFASMAVLDGGNVTVCLHEKAPGSASSDGASDIRRYERHWTPVHLDLHVGDLDAVLAKVRAAGGRIERELRTQGPRPVAFCSDPFGNGLCLLGEGCGGPVRSR